MKISELCQQFEKHYQVEHDRREKLYSRLNVPLGVIVATLGFLSFLIKIDTSSFESSGQYGFYSLIFISVFSLITACYHFKQSWSGSSDMFMPVSSDINDYIELLKKTYQNYDNQEQLVNDSFNNYLIEKYVLCSSFNAEVNDYRSNQIYKLIRALSVSISASFLAFLLSKVVSIL